MQNKKSGFNWRIPAYGILGFGIGFSFGFMLEMSIAVAIMGAVIGMTLAYLIKEGKTIIISAKPKRVRKLRNRYNVGNKLHEGGMGSVFLAEDTYKNETVVLKEAIAGTGRTQIFSQKLKEEANILQQCNHPNIVKYKDSFTEGNKFYLVVEFINGQTLENKFERFSAGEIESRNIMVNVLNALEYLHNNNVIHRDLTPDNIMIDYTNKVTIIDFGAGAIGGGTGTQIGKQYLTAPETIQSGIADARSDIYAAGITLAFLLSGIKPDSWMDAKSFLHGRCIKWNLIEIFAKATDIDPDKRYQTAREMKDALMQAQTKINKQ